MADGVLNANVEFSSASEQDQKAFIERFTVKRLFPAGYELYKFTQYPLANSDGAVTRWWSSVAPLDDDDPGFHTSSQRASGLGVSGQQFARARSAVTAQWNAMDGLLRARLLLPVYGFVGRCSHQKFDERPEYANVVYIGGAWQLWIPNLTVKEIAEAKP